MSNEIVIPAIHRFLKDTPKRYKAEYGGRGSGKSHSVARTLLLMGMERPIRVACAREIMKSIKDSVHQLLSDVIVSNPSLKSFYKILDSEIRGKNGTTIKFLGLRHNTRDIKSLEGVDVCWIEEAESVSDASYEILIPTIRKPGSEIWATFNVRSVSDPTYRRFITEAGDDTISIKVSWRDNPFFPDVLRQEMEKLKATDYEAYLHVWEGEPDTRRSGYILCKQLAAAKESGRICRVPYDPAEEVFTAWDLGWADSTSIWWLQFVGRELRWLEYYENTGQDLNHYAKVIKDKPYNYGRDWHFLPHDGAAGNIRGDSVSSQLESMGIRNRVMEREQDITPAIETLRQTIGFSVFDAKGCVDGLNALENYQYEWDEDRQIFKQKPLHNWASNAADAARYACRAAFEVKGMRQSKGAVTVVPNMVWSIF